MSKHTSKVGVSALAVVALFITLDPGRYLSTNFDIFLFTPAQAIGSLSASVSDLMTQGALSHGNGRSLLAKLNAALHQSQAGHSTPVPHQLSAFTHEVAALVHAGRLDAAEGDRLIGLTERIVRSVAS